ncbi:MAG: PIN domain-containing protein [Syntrophales bacterium]
MYVFDTSALYTLGNYYPSRFPTIWEHIDDLIQERRLWSVREVRREIENNCPFSFIESWTQKNRRIFRTPNRVEMEIVAQIFRRPNYLGLVSRNNMLKGYPVADPFIIAAAKAHKGIVVTQETFKASGARIPTVCGEFDVACINVEQFLEKEQLKY